MCTRLNEDAQFPDLQPPETQPPESQSPGARSRLIGRGAECAAIREALESARRGFSATLVLRGEAGIGKSSLLEYAIESAPDLRALRVTGIESEMELGFAALHQLVRPFSAQFAGLPGPQRKALASAFGIADGPAPDRFLVGLGILTLISEAANERGLLCVIDDAQWLDQASADVLCFVARRLHADRIAFLFAIREATGYQVPWEGLRTLRVPGLTPAAAREVIMGLVTGPLDPGVGDQIAERSAGNPLALTETARELTAEQLAGAALLPDPLPLGTDVQRKYWQKAAALPPDQREFLLLAAVEPSGDPDLFERAAMLLGLDPRIASSGQISELLQVTDRVTFRHPLIRSAVYTGSPYQDRRRVHAAIAAVSDPERDADRIAWHRAAAAREPDEETAALLERSADRAKSRGGLAAGASFLRRAAELTPDAGHRAERLLAAAEAEFAAGRPSQAMTLLDQAAPDLRGARAEAAGLQLRGSIQFALGDGHRAPFTSLGAARALAALDQRASRDTLLESMLAAIYSGPRARREALAAARAAGPAGAAGSATTLGDLLLDGYTELLARDMRKAVPLLRRALSALTDDSLPEDQGLRWYGYGIWCASELLDFDAWRGLSDRWATLCRKTGALTTLPLALDYLGTAQSFTGHISAAEAANAEGRDILTATGAPDRLGIRAVEILAPAWRGQADSLRRAAAAMTRNCAERGRENGARYPYFALAILEISMRDYEAALSHARMLLDEDAPYLGSIILPEAVEAAVHCGDRATAELALGRISARATAGPTDSVLGILARGRALVLRDTGADADIEALFAEATARFGRGQALSDLARTQLLFGEWLRRKRRRRQAIHELRAAHATFEAIGAEKFAERASMELAAAGARTAGRGRPRTADAAGELTERESQIASLVAAGATNAEVAAQLFISANTVDYHLRHIYRKLGVTSRTMLAARFRGRL